MTIGIVLVVGNVVVVRVLVVVIVGVVFGGQRRTFPRHIGAREEGGVKDVMLKPYSATAWWFTQACK